MRSAPLPNPECLFLVRHGQSAGNVARDFAEANDLADIAVTFRDMDIPLSPLGEKQAQALGRWLKAQAHDQQPTVIFSSSYLRAQQTAQHLLQAAEMTSLEIITDERLREREFGTIDRLTKKGITAKFPLEAESYAHLGKFYYRPPGGESWCDVILRLRNFHESLIQTHPGHRVMIICHAVVVLCYRYLLEKMTEADILKIDRENQMANASITQYRFDPLKLEHFNFTVPLEEAGEPVTRKSDVKAADKT